MARTTGRTLPNLHPSMVGGRGLLCRHFGGVRTMSDTLILSPCDNCGVEYVSGRGWRHSSECVDYDPPRELTMEDLEDIFGDDDPAKYF